MKFLKITSAFLGGIFLLSGVAMADNLPASPPPFTTPASAPSASPPAAAPNSTTGAPSQKLNVEGLRQKYYAKGVDTEFRVVQNRLYSKAGKISLGVFGSSVSADPFLSIQALGASLDYYFSEYFGVGVWGYRAFTTPSSALIQFQQQTNATTDTDYFNSFLGAQLKASLIYGKLSLLGTSIIYYDLYLTGGAGSLSTESGSYIAPTFGIGQQVYLNQHFALNIAYTGMIFSENVPEKVRPTSPGQIGFNRSNFTNILSLGVNIILGGS